jgi:hypothetical protein
MVLLMVLGAAGGDLRKVEYSLTKPYVFQAIVY